VGLLGGAGQQPGAIRARGDRVAPKGSNGVDTRQLRKGLCRPAVMVKALRGETRHVIPFPSMVLGTDHRTAGVWVLRSPARTLDGRENWLHQMPPREELCLLPGCVQRFPSRSLSPPGARHEGAVCSAFVGPFIRWSCARSTVRSNAVRSKYQRLRIDAGIVGSARRDVTRDGCCARFGSRPGMRSALSYLQAVDRETPITMAALV
jgi:hypothetical protein